MGDTWDDIKVDGVDIIWAGDYNDQVAYIKAISQQFGIISGGDSTG